MPCDMIGETLAEDAADPQLAQMFDTCSVECKGSCPCFGRLEHAAKGPEFSRRDLMEKDSPLVIIQIVYV